MFIILPVRVDCISQRFKTALFCSSVEVESEATNPRPFAWVARDSARVIIESAVHHNTAS